MRKVWIEQLIKSADGFAMKYVCKLLQCIGTKSADEFAIKYARELLQCISTKSADGFAMKLRS